MSVVQRTAGQLVLWSSLCDGAVAVGGVSLTLLQAKHVRFPSGFHLAAFQLTFLLPRIATAALAERVAEVIGTHRALVLSMVVGVFAAYTVCLGLIMNSLLLLFASRFIAGLLHHQEMLFTTSGGLLTIEEKRLRSAISWGMTIGFVSSGIAGDYFADSIPVQKGCVALEAFALVLTVFSYLLTLPHARTTTIKYLSTPLYVRWLRSSVLPLRSPSGPPARLLALLLVAVGVNQCLYPLSGPGYGFSYTFTGLHLVFNLLSPPFILSVVNGLLKQSSWNDKRRATAAVIVLLFGVCVVPTQLAASYLSYYLGSFFLIDMPAIIVQSYLVEVLLGTTGTAQRECGNRLVAHLIRTAKMFSAPLYLIVVNAVKTHIGVCLISMPCALYVVVFLLTGREGTSAFFGLTFAVAALSFFV